MSPLPARSLAPAGTGDSALTVRIATPDDAGSIEALIAQHVPSGNLLPRASTFIAARAHDFVVADVSWDEDTAVVVGCAHLDEYSPSVAELRSLAVASSHHGQGIGRALVARIQRLAEIRGHHLLFAVSNDEAFFRRLGFEPSHVPELDRERSEISRYKGVFAKPI